LVHVSKEKVQEYTLSSVGYIQYFKLVYCKLWYQILAWM